MSDYQQSAVTLPRSRSHGVAKCDVEQNFGQVVNDSSILV